MQILSFTPEERKQLYAITDNHRGTSLARRASALLKLEYDDNVDAAAEQAQVGRRTIYNWILRFLEGIIVAVVIAISVIFTLFYLKYLSFLLDKRNREIIDAGGFSWKNLILILAPILAALLAGIAGYVNPGNILRLSCDVISYDQALPFLSVRDDSWVIAFVGIAIFFVSWLGSWIWFIVRRNTITLISAILITGLIVPFAIILTYNGIIPLNSASRKSIDARRIVDVKQIQLALELFRDNKKIDLYPFAAGNSSVERWQSLMTQLVDSHMFPAAVHDPCSESVAGHEYDYRTSPDGTSYVIRAILSDPGNASLVSSGDKDGQVYGVWCGEQGKELEYCAVP
jgi:hypothetical protein